MQAILRFNAMTCSTCKRARQVQTCVNCVNVKGLYQEAPATLLLDRKLCRLKHTLVASHLVHPVHKLQGSCMTGTSVYTDSVTCMSWPDV